MVSRFLFDLEGDLAAEVAKANPMWQWKEDVRRPGGIVIMSTDGPIARISRAHSAREYNVYGMDVTIWPHSCALGGERLLHESSCKTWAEGVRMVEEWLGDIPLWGTPDRIEWVGFVKAK